MPVLHGSCLCGGVRFEIAGTLTPPSNCHCSMCRKQQGAAFRSRARVRAADFNWVQGEDLVKFYESTPGTFRGFCSVCGSPIINKFDTRAKAVAFRPAAISEYGIALATIDDDPGVRPGFHTFGTVGRVSHRVAKVSAIGRRLLDLKYSMVAGRAPKYTWTCPPIRSVNASASPR
jgi:hypothetical protein